MAVPAARLRDLVAATKPRLRDAVDPASSPWTRPALAGRLVELSGTGASTSLTFAAALVLDAQRRGETAAWVTARESCFYPPDLADNGVDLAALPVVRVPEAEHVVRAGERLVRSGAFDLVVFDLVVLGHGAQAGVALPLLTRLSGLAEKHETAVLFLTEKRAAAASLSSVVSLRVESRRTRNPDAFHSVGADPCVRPRVPTAVETESTLGGHGGPPLPRRMMDAPSIASASSFTCELVALRDKRRPAGWTHEEARRGPDGVR